MAIIYKKGNPDLEYTGVDKVMHNFGSTLERIKSGVKKVVTRIPRALESERAGRRQRNKELIENNFGSVEAYEQSLKENFSTSTPSRKMNKRTTR